MGRLTIGTDGGRIRYMPAARVAGSISWELESDPSSVDLRLFWYTVGKGDRDVGIVDSVTFPHPGLRGRQGFSFELPESPHSFSGRLISLVWALELVVNPSGDTQRLEIIVSPTGREILLYEADARTDGDSLSNG